MDSRHRGLYLEWSQSPPTTLGIGPLTGPFTHTFSIPIDLLYSRSRVFRELIDSPPQELEVGHPRFILPTSIAPHTVEDFLIWSLAHSPQISSLEPSFEEATNLGVFAQQYHIPALTNQVTDSIRAHLASDEWTLQAALVDAIYGAAPAGAPLREVVRAALGKLPKLTGDGGEGGRNKEERDAWKEVILKHSQLGWDFIEAAGEKWTAQGYLSGWCRFHDHDEVKGLKGVGTGAACDGCPYASEDCFPVVEGRADRENGSITEPVTTATAADAAAADGGADEPTTSDTPAEPPSTTADDVALEPAKSPAEGPRVGNSIMIMTPRDSALSLNASSLTSIDENDVEPGARLSDIEPAADEPEESNGAASQEDVIDDTTGTVTSDDVDEPLTPVQEDHTATPDGGSSKPVLLQHGTSASGGGLVADGPAAVAEIVLRTAGQDAAPTPAAGTSKEAGTMTEGQSKAEGADGEAKLSKKARKKKQKRANSESAAA